MRRLTTFLATPAGRVARYLISLALLVVLAAQIDWAELTAARTQLSLPLIVAALVLVGLTFPIQAARWWLLLRAQQIPLSFHWSHVVTWIGQFYNAFLLGGIGGDAARVYYLLRDAATQRAAGLTTLVIDRATGLLLLFAVPAVALTARTGAFVAEPGLRWLFITASILTLGGIVFAIWLLRTDPGRWPAPLPRMLGPDRLATAARLLACVRATPGTHSATFLLGAAIWLLDFIAVWLLALAIGLPLPFLDTCIAMSVAYAATVLPISVGGHGVREGAFLGTLAALGLLATPAARDLAPLLALLVWVATVFWSLFGGLVVLAAPRLLPPRPTPT
jgi:uncharacterized membrane protein YbhN (UPF0104 family)